MATSTERLKERDAMRCRSCGREERASEGYPCASCGTFVCIMCVLRGVTCCATCVRARTAGTGGAACDEPPPAWPEH